MWWINGIFIRGFVYYLLALIVNHFHHCVIRAYKTLLQNVQNHIITCVKNMCNICVTLSYIRHIRKGNLINLFGGGS